MIGVIPAAGSGTRMRPFTRANPKELFHINRKAVIDHVIESMHNSMDVDKVLIIVGSHKSAIIDHVGNAGYLNQKNLNICYLFQEEQKGLAHAIYQAKGWVNEDFIVQLGDTIIHPKEELSRMIDIHKKEKPFATILATETTDPTKYGTLKIDENNNLLNCIEKPTLEQAVPLKDNGKYWIVACVYIFTKEIFDYIEKTPKGANGEYQITDSIKLALNNGKKVKVVKLKGKYMDIGNWDSAEDAHNFFRKLKNKEIGTN